MGSKIEKQRKEKGHHFQNLLFVSVFHPTLQSATKNLQPPLPVVPLNLALRQRLKMQWLYCADLVNGGIWEDQIQNLPSQGCSK